MHTDPPISSFDKPYAPSWVNLLTAWVARLPGSDWMYYGVLWGILFSAMTVIQWNQGGYPPGTLNFFHLVLTGSAPFLLLLVRHLNEAATNAMQNARPLLQVTDADLQLLTFRLTTLPARASLVAAVFPLVFVLPNLSNPITIFLQSQVALTPLSLGFTLFISLLLSVTSGIVLYQMYRQTRIVNSILKTYARVDLFHLSPLYGFSHLTSQASIALLLLATAFYLASPDLTRDPANIFTALFGIALCLAVFILPLVGIHNRILMAKERALGETTQRIETAISKLHTTVDTVDWNITGQIKDALQALDAEQKMLQSIPTWPWQPETPRLLLSALFIPLMLFLIQIVIQKFLSP